MASHGPSRRSGKMTSTATVPCGRKGYISAMVMCLALVCSVLTVDSVAPPGGSGTVPFVSRSRGGSSRKRLDAKLPVDAGNVTALSPLADGEVSIINDLGWNLSDDGLESEGASDAGVPVEPAASALRVTKRSGAMEPLSPAKILARMRKLGDGLDRRHVDVEAVAAKIARGAYAGVTTAELDTLAAETAACMSTLHPDYAVLASRIGVSALHKATEGTFAGALDKLRYEVDPKTGEKSGFISEQLMDLVSRRTAEIDGHIVHSRDYDLTYFGFKTLEKNYLLRDRTPSKLVVERPQYMFMRVALGIHCALPASSPQEEDRNLQAAFETYDMLSEGYFMHASPTLFHSGTTHPQLSSCFLLQMTEDSIIGIYDTLKRCAVISKGAGGIGLSVHNIRARGSHIAGTRGTSNGLVPMLRVFDVTSRYVDQGGGKRPGAFAVYIEPWHSDIFDVLDLKKNHGKEENRARDLFYGLWVPDLFMKRVEEDGEWTLMCPHECPGLSDVHGKQFEELYHKYEHEKRYTKKVKARELWNAILDAQTETGTPYILYKDTCNAKSNQKNLGTIKSSNLCTEIIQYTDTDEVAVCNLASVCLPKFISSSRGPHGSVAPESPRAAFDHAALHRAVKILVRNLNRVIDVNLYPLDEARASNSRHRPVGVGVSGLADAFARLGLPFDSPGAKKLNEEIFETIYHAALEASCELAQKDGPYESFPKSPASRGELQHHLWGLDDAATPSHRHGRPRDWRGLRDRIVRHGLRNSLLVAPMPTASTSQILGVNECFEPFSSNLYLRRVRAGEFIMINPHLLRDLTDRGLWNQEVRNQLMRDGGSVADIDLVPPRLKELYKTAWEIKQRDIIDMAADRGKFIDQSQSMNIFMSSPTRQKLTAMHFYAWKKGLKTGMYYLRTRAAAKAIQYTVDTGGIAGVMPSVAFPSMGGNDDTCWSCQG